MIPPTPLSSHTTSPPRFLLPNPNKSRFHRTKSHTPRPISRHFHLLSKRNPNFKVSRVVNSDNLEIASDCSQSDDSDLPVELCYTRTLPPALTLEHGFIKIEEQVEKLRLNPPTCKSGIVRFQVAVPPSAKALSWFCSQPQSLEVFPQFYFSKEKNMDYRPPLDLLSFDGPPGVSGIGASVYFTGASAMSNWSSINRYLSVDSPLIRAYGFIGINFDTESSFIKHGTGSFYLFIPQIELDECEGISLLAATLAWDEYSICTFNKAIHSFKFSLSQGGTSDLNTATEIVWKAAKIILRNWQGGHNEDVGASEEPCGVADIGVDMESDNNRLSAAVKAIADVILSQQQLKHVPSQRDAGNQKELEGDKVEQLTHVPSQRDVHNQNELEGEKVEQLKHVPSERDVCSQKVLEGKKVEQLRVESDWLTL